jgi:hypothetical protein
MFGTKSPRAGRVCSSIRVTDARATPREVTYDLLAKEYYDPALHPTCANFRDASRALISRLLPDVPAAASAEVGCGASLLAEILAERGVQLDGLLLTDRHEGMLAHSREWGTRGARLVATSAAALPVEDHSLSLVVASLADPYCNDGFWQETERVLTSDGQAIVTLPSYVWAQRFRVNGDPPATARFVLTSGEQVLVPSVILPPDSEQQRIAQHGLCVEEFIELMLVSVPAPHSPKLSVLDDHDAVAAAYVVTRRKT